MTSKGSESIPNVDSKQELQGELTSADTVQSGDTEFPSPERSSRADDGSARQETGFDPTPYLRQLHGRGRAGGGDYLDVKWRLLWLRKEHPDAEIVTELVQHDPQMAIFKATVTVPSGGKATGYGSETASDFPDFIEKAETKAIGRALNALGIWRPVRRISASGRPGARPRSSAAGSPGGPRRAAGGTAAAR